MLRKKWIILTKIKADKINQLIKKCCPKSSVRKLLQDLARGKNSERSGINFVWRKFLTKVFPNLYMKYGDYKSTGKYNIPWDNYLISKNFKALPLRLLIEFKRQAAYTNGSTLKSQQNRAQIAIQLLYYMNSIRNINLQEPNVLMGADNAEAFVVSAKPFYDKYIKNVNCHHIFYWGYNNGHHFSPSSAYKNDPNLFNSLCNDEILNVRPFHFDEGDFNSKYQEILAMLNTIVQYGHNNFNYKVPITLNSIDSIYFQFRDLIKPHQDPSSVNVVNDFINIITHSNTDNYFTHNDRLFHMTNNKHSSSIDIYPKETRSFLRQYDYKNVSAKVKKQIFGHADHLINIDKRRFRGDYWTPDIWAAHANDYMMKHINKHYRNNCLIWDCAAGAKNLTRNLDYNDLYSSTFYQAQVDQGSIYNTRSNPDKHASFQYDFLNDDIDISLNSDPTKIKMPTSLFNDLKSANKNDKTVVFYTNPPYGTAGNNKAITKAQEKLKSNIGKGKKTHIADSSIHDLMKKGKKYYMGAASQELYVQFFTRIFKLVNDFHLKNVYIAFFTEPQLFTGSENWKKFDEYLFSHYQWECGFLINAGEFSDTSKSWPITFSIYKLKKHPHKKPFRMKILHSNKGHIVYDGVHTFRKVFNNTSLSRWVRQPDQHKTIAHKLSSNKVPQLSSGLKLNHDANPGDSLRLGSIGYLHVNSNNVEHSNYVFLLSGSAYDGHGVNVMPNKNSLDRSVITFATRLVIKTEWFNAKDNFKRPNKALCTTSNEWKYFVNDCLIYSLFSNSSEQCSYREWPWSNSDIPRTWRNQWFWLSHEKMADYTKNSNDATERNIYNEACKNDVKNTYIYKVLKKRKNYLSPVAKKVLKDATQVLKDSLKYRHLTPKIRKKENHKIYFLRTFLNTWDAGWYQLKQIPQIQGLSSYNNFKHDFGLPKNYKDLLKIPKLKELKIYHQTLTDEIAHEVYKLKMLIPPITHINNKHLGQQNLFDIL